MNKVIVMMTLKQFWSRKVRILLVVVIMAIPVIMDVMYRQVSHTKVLTEAEFFFTLPMLALIVGAGIVGQDISDGILPSIFSRPIKRWTYVFSKWLTVSTIVVALTLLSLGCHFLFISCVTHNLVEHIPETVSRVVLKAFGTTSVLILLSSLLPGAADVGVILLICVATFAMLTLGACFNVPGMIVTAASFNAVVFPSFEFIYIRSLQSLFSIEVGRYVAIVLLCLSVSVLLVNQKELSYGSS